MNCFQLDFLRLVLRRLPLRAFELLLRLLASVERLLLRFWDVLDVDRHALLDKVRYDAIFQEDTDVLMLDVSRCVT